VGGVFGFLAVFLRRWLSETPVFEEMRQRRALVKELPLKAVLRGHGVAVVVSMLLTWVLTAGIVVVILMTPTLLQKLHGFPPAQALEAASVATLSLAVGCVAYGLFADRVGVGRALGLGCAVLLGVTYLFYLGVGTSPEQLVPLYALIGFCVGVVGVVPTVMVRAFPAEVRFSGLSFSYNVAYAIFGGLTPLFVTLMMKSHPLAPAHYVAALCGLGITVAVYLLSVGRARFTAVTPAP
jgi:MFS family permease